MRNTGILENAVKNDIFRTEVQSFWQELEWRFQDSKQFGPILVFISFPFA